MESVQKQHAEENKPVQGLPTRKKCWLCGIIVLVLLAVGTILLWPERPQPVDPTYDGKTISQWLREYDPSPPSNSTQIVAHATATRAFRKMGDPGALFAARQLSRHTPWPIDKAIQWLKRVPGLNQRFMTNDERENKAIDLLTWVNKNTTVAIPDLVRVVASKRHSHYARERALGFLNEMPPDPARVLPVLVSSLHDPNIRASAAVYLMRYGRAGSVAAPSLRQMLQLPKPKEPAAAIVALINMGEFQEEALAKARDIAANGNPIARATLMEIFRYMTENHQLIIPLLTHAALHDEDPTTRRLAAQQLKHFAPATAANSGIH